MFVSRKNGTGTEQTIPKAQKYWFSRYSRGAVHNVQGQIDMINKALEPVIEDEKVAGMGLWKITLSQGDESGICHAAKWETSDMMLKRISFYNFHVIKFNQPFTAEIHICCKGKS